MKAPVAKRKSLILLAGVVWTVTGLALMLAALVWLRSFHPAQDIALAGGAAAGFIIYRFGFSRLAGANLARIRSQSPGKERVCVFAFQNWRSYLIIVFMMTLGYTLRHSPLPKIFIAPIYAAIGLGLALSSLRYYAALR